MSEQTRRRDPSPESQAEARRRYEDGEALTAIERSLGVSRATLKRISDRDGWSVTLPTCFLGVRKQTADLLKRRAVARTRYEAGEDLNTVAQALKLNAVALKRVARRERWSASQVVCFDEVA
jgi:DNA invertase Pin-like site-specific DNA recombinase